VADEIGVDAVKTGMLGTAQAVEESAAVEGVASGRRVTRSRGSCIA
jgi:hydroxymethylpyrimidine/phosphomethylpyrimidine kinase